ncbi:hypothetical protein [Dyadobacter sp. NIV53]|uniref:hypothetical protein n=1 Tax=Dyadobacter sp. NIV53 TaxID=2861765 RepID=UPI001C878E4A|nr:hypothetical protein [Dyadobacter sp. NIV53]
MLKLFKTAYALQYLLCEKVLRFHNLTFLLLLFPQLLKAQDPPRQEIDINQFIQNLFPAPSEDADYENLYESLFQLYANPLDLNTVTSDELAATFILSDVQIRSFFLIGKN